jgi:hypothetical protein
MVAGRLLSITTVLVLGVLGAGFAAWSGLTNPQVAGEQLQVAELNTAAASNFTITIDEVEDVVGTSEVATIHEVVHYQAPDRQSVVENTQVAGIPDAYSYKRTRTQIGDSCWTTVSGPQGLEPLACQASELSPHPLTTAETRSSVTYSNGVYSLSAAAARKFLSRSISGPIGMATFEARLAGLYLGWQRVSFNVAQANATFQIVQISQLSDVGTTPSIATPPGPPTATAS